MKINSNATFKIFFLPIVVLSLVKMSGKTVLAPLNMEFGEMKCHTRVLQLSTNKKSKMSNMNFLLFFLPRDILEGLPNLT
jgi:hypothetical protein